MALDSGYWETNDNYKIQLSTIDLHPTEAIVFRYSFGDIPLDVYEEAFNHIVEKFPNNAVVAIPDKTSLESCSKDVLENIISMISEIIESL